MTTIYPLLIKSSPIQGRGCYAGSVIPARKKIGNLSGEIVKQREGRKRVKLQKSLAVVEFGNGLSLDASVNPNELRFVNHSCDPNSFMRCCYNKVEIYAKRKIHKGEEITCDYGETHHEGQLACTCGASNCRGAI